MSFEHGLCRQLLQRVLVEVPEEGSFLEVVGEVTGAVELYLRKPSVGDFSRLREDTVEIKGWWRNRLSRVLLVFLLSTIGSAVGTYVAGFRIFDRLFA